MSSTIQEITGTTNVIERLAERIKFYRAFLDKKASVGFTGNEIEFDYEAICPTKTEVEFVEELIKTLARRITGEMPDTKFWQTMGEFCHSQKLIEEGYWERENEYFRFALNWIEKSKAYIEYLIGLDSAVGLVDPTNSINRGELNSTTYDVALSFAGEDRKYAKELAEYLSEDGFSVFYDEYEQSSLWGRNLYTHLSDVYQNKAKYCVMFISTYYAKKLWTKRERESAQARAFKDSREYILPVRIDDTEVPGIEGTIGYLDLRNITIKDVFENLKSKFHSEGS